MNKKSIFSSFFLIFLISIFFIKKNSITKIFSYIAYPFFSFGWHMRNFYNNNFSNYEEYEVLKKKYLNLKSHYNQLKNNLSYYSYIDTMLRLYNNNIPDSLSYKYTTIPARILSIIDTGIEKKFYINRGLIDSLKEGMPVVYGNNILGKIQKVFPLYSEVTSIIDTNSKISFVIEKTSIRGIAQGCGSDNTMQALYINNINKNINIGMKLFSTGEGIVYPSGFLIGDIKKVLSDSSLHTTIIINPSIKIENIMFCFVLKDLCSQSESSQKELQDHCDMKEILKKNLPESIPVLTTPSEEIFDNCFEGHNQSNIDDIDNQKSRNFLSDKNNYVNSQNQDLEKIKIKNKKEKNHRDENVPSLDSDTVGDDKRNYFHVSQRDNKFDQNIHESVQFDKERTKPSDDNNCKTNCDLEENDQIVQDVLNQEELENNHQEDQD
jgi:rod shape-determining protein MreC